MSDRIESGCVREEMASYFGYWSAWLISVILLILILFTFIVSYYHYYLCLKFMKYVKSIWSEQELFNVGKMTYTEFVFRFDVCNWVMNDSIESDDIIVLEFRERSRYYTKKIHSLFTVVVLLIVLLLGLVYVNRLP